MLIGRSGGANGRRLRLLVVAAAVAAGLAAVPRLEAAVPTVTITSAPPTYGNTSTTAVLAWTTTGAPTSVVCSVDDGAFAPCAAPMTLSNLAVSWHKLIVRAANAEGSADATRVWQVVAGTAPTTPDASGPIVIADTAVAVHGPNLKIRPTAVPAGGSRATLVAARNEFESFQVSFEARGGPRTVDVRLARPLTNGAQTIPAANVTIYREAFLDITQVSDLEGARGRWPDALIPDVDPYFGEHRNAFPTVVPRGENRVAYVDVLAPAGAVPGLYRGALAVTVAGATVEVPIDLTVLRFVMPSTTTLRSAFAMSFAGPCRATAGCVGHASREASKALYGRAALDNRITLAVPSFSVLGDNERRIFRAHTLPLINGTAPTRLAGARLTAVRVAAGAGLGGWREEARAHGFADRAFVFGCDEPQSDATLWSRCRAAADAAHAAWPAVKVLATTDARNATRFGGISRIDILAPVLNYLEDKAWDYAGLQTSSYAAFRAADPSNEVWAYTSCMSFGCVGPGPWDEDPYFTGWPSYAIDQPASQARAMGWMAYKFDLSGEYYWDSDKRLATAWSDQYVTGGNGDGTLFYPGEPSVVGGSRHIPVESLRLKLIRDGHEDYEYLAELTRRGQGGTARQLVESLYPHAWSGTRTDAELTAAHSRLAALVG